MATPANLTLILGLGETGVAAARWCLRLGDALRIVDTRTEPPGVAALHDVAPSPPTPLPQAGEGAPAGAGEGLRHAAQVEFCLGGALDAVLLDGVDRIVISPGLAPEQSPVAEFLEAARARDIAVINEVELFALALADLRESRQYAPKILAVTGTNGKTTVTALTRHLLVACGVNARAAGNISPAATAALLEALNNDDLPDVWVLELSSFQLASLHTLAPDAAVVLNISQDHLDWHGDMTAYATAKARMFVRAGVCIVNRDDAAVCAMVENLDDVSVRSFGSTEPLLVGDAGLTQDHGVAWLTAGESEELDAPERKPKTQVNRRQKTLLRPTRATARAVRMMPADALRLRGLHNALNAQAALLLARALGLAWHALLPALRDYAGEPHRMAFVRNIGGVDFVNDSKGTNVGATVAALLGGGEGKTVLIAGGLGKGQDFSPLAAPVAQHARAVVLIGQDAPIIAQALADTGVFIEHADTLPDAVERALALAEPGDTVLLSPACASMDMFQNYARRGDVFVDSVHALALAQGEVA